MKVFISGCAGFLGSHLADRFLELGYQVVGCDSLIGGYVDNVSPDVEFHKVDLRDLEALPKLLEGCDLVYHTACTAYEGLSVFSPALIVENTLQISVNLMTAAIKAGVKRFVHCSSMARYGTQDKIPFTEDMLCKPQDPYGIAKFASEQILQNLAQVHGIELVIAVPHNIIGPRQKYDDPFRNVASIMINLLLQGRDPVIYGDGEQLRCFSDVEDDIGCLVKMATDERAVGEIFNIGPDEDPVTINELSKRIGRLMNKEVRPIYMPGRPQEVKLAVCSSDKIRKYFNYKTTVTLDQSLQKMIRYITDSGPRAFKYHLDLEIVTDKTPKTWSDRLF